MKKIVNLFTAEGQSTTVTFTKMEKIPQNPCEGKTHFLITSFPYFSLGTQQAFEHFFIPSDSIYDVAGSLNILNNTVQSYYNIIHDAVGNFSHLTDDEGIAYPMKMIYTSYDKQLKLITQQYLLTRDTPLGPFVGTDQELMEIFHNLDSFSLQFSLTCTELILDGQAADILLDVVILYLAVGGTITPKISITRTYLNDVVLEDEGWLGMVLLVLSVFSVILSMRRIFVGYRLYLRCKDGFEKIPGKILSGYFLRKKVKPVCLKWEDIPLKVKFRFLASWDMFSIIGDLSIITASALRILTDFGNPASVLSRLFTGVGLFILCVNITRYLEYNLAFYTLIVTLRVSFKSIASFVISAAPTFMGFLLCGWVVFSPYSNLFLDMNTTAISLFGLMNGDSVHDAFGDVYVMNFPGFSRFYMYCFVFFFANVALKIFFIIIEQAYQLAKVLTTDRSAQGETCLNQNEILLWDSLQGTFNMGTLFELLELPELELERQNIAQSPPPGSLIQSDPSVGGSLLLDPPDMLIPLSEDIVLSEQILDVVEQYQKKFLSEIEEDLVFIQQTLVSSLSKELMKLN